MNYRKFAIRVLVISLCIAAFAGFLVLLLPSATLIIAKLIGTAISTAISATLLLLAIKSIETVQFRFFGSTLGILTFIIYLCTIGAMWSDSFTALRSIDLPEKLAITAFVTAGCGVLMLLGAACVSIKRLFVAGITFYVIWLLVLFAWLVYYWVFHFNKSPANDVFVYIVVTLQNYSLLFAILLIHKQVVYKTIGLLLAAASCIIVQSSLVFTDGHIEGTPTLFIISLVTAWLSSEMAIWNLITFRKPKYSLLKCELATAIIVGIALGSFCILVWHQLTLGSTSPLPEALVRISTSFGILGSAAFLGLLIGRYIWSNSFLVHRTCSLHCECPRCRNAIELHQGKSKCCNCGLAFKLQMEAYGCRVCHYDLTGLQDSNVCPECGEPITLMSPVE